MKLKDWLASATQSLEEAAISTARLDCLVLLEDILNTNRTQILAEPERQITELGLTRLNGLIQKRAQHIPLAQLRGKTEFYGREFIVNQHVLEPRPETETMIDICRSLTLPDTATLADVGSGSGALGITAALEMPNVSVTLIEIDTEALRVSKQNVEMHKISAHVVQADLLPTNHEHFDVLLCNLPYVPNDFHINTAAAHEPRIAIFGGPDGLDIYRRLFQQLSMSPVKPRYVLTESLPPQHAQLAAIAGSAGFTSVKEDDFIQLFRAD